MPHASSDVLFFCDVGPSIGVGHLMRCVALAEGFLAAGHSVHFAADVHEVEFARLQLDRRGIGSEPGVRTVDEHLSLVQRIGPRVVVVDSYLSGNAVYDALRSAPPTLLALVDGDPQGRAADLYLDQNIGAEHDSRSLAVGSRRLAGLDFALMRDDVKALRPPAPRSDASDPPTVLAFFGGTDAFGVAPVATRALIGSAAAFNLTVVAGNPTTTDELHALAEQCAPHQQVAVIAPTDRLAHLVTEADLVISAAGTSTWELLCLGAPCALIAVAENQHESYARTVEAGLAAGLGHLAQVRADPEAVSRALAELLTSEQRRARLRATGWAAVDGAGRDRVVAAAFLGEPLG